MSIEKVNITIIEHKELKKAVSARELYEFLEIKEDFTDWFKRYLQYGFIEKDDYIIYLENRVNSDNRRGRPSVDYLMTVEMAKEISMLQRSEKGKEARKYFIECERKLKEHQLAIPDFSNPYEAALAWAERYKREQLAIEERDIAIKTKSQINNKITATATAMATASAAVRKVNKLENELGKLESELGRGRDFKKIISTGYY
jgi:anti-repressor protein